MVRFFISTEAVEQDRIQLTGENAAHARVLRLKPGEAILACDETGTEYVCEVREIEADRVLLEISESRKSENEPAVRVSVYMAFPKGDKLEHVIQKATELGAYEIVAFPSARSISRPDEKALEKKRERWQKIAASAAEQSGRGQIPPVVVLSSFTDAVRRAAQADLAVLFYENERATTLRMALEKDGYQSVSILSGPEGGLEAWEVEQAANAGMLVCTLGRRILRCETAPLCGLSAVMYASGEF